jgi:hypothetical protein
MEEKDQIKELKKRNRQLERALADTKVDPLCTKKKEAKKKGGCGKGENTHLFPYLQRIPSVFHVPTPQPRLLRQDR